MPKESAPKPAEAPAETIEPAASADLPADDEPQREPLPTHKDDLVAVAIDRGIPSYEAWDMTVPELTKRLES